MEESQENSSPEKYEFPYEEKPPKMKKSKNPRRFSDEQIRSLESIFKLESKLEPRKKLQLAKELGLQPRQVAIWFQNKRARWKSRQIEQEYKVLRAKYDALHIQFDDLKREKQSLQKQLEELSGLIKNLDKGNLSDGNGELKECHTRSNEGMGCIYSDDAANSISEGYGTKHMEEEELLRWVEEDEISHLGSPETWCNLSSCGQFDLSSSGILNSDWWES